MRNFRCLGVFGLVGFLSVSLAAGQKLEFSGFWFSEARNEWDKIVIEVSFLQEETLVLTLDLNGELLGPEDPPPLELIGSFGPGWVEFEKREDPHYGDLLIRAGFDRAFTLQLENLPSMDAQALYVEGELSPELHTLEGRFRLLVSPGSEETGVVEAVRTSDRFFQVAYLPQWGGGGGFQSDIIILNRVDRPVSGVLVFADDEGGPLSLALTGEGERSGKARFFSVEPYRSIEFSSSGEGDLFSGSAALLVDGAISLLGRFEQESGSFVGVAGTEVASSGFLVPARIGGRFQTGVAIRNILGRKNSIRLTLRREDGIVIHSEETKLGPYGHLSRFLSELFPGVVGAFEGTVSVEGSDESLAGVALLVDHTTGHWTALPVASLDPK